MKDSRQWKGIIYEVDVYGRALEATEIQDLYTRGSGQVAGVSTVNTSGLLSSSGFLEESFSDVVVFLMD